MVSSKSSIYSYGSSALGDVQAGEKVIELRGITKRFPGVVANDQIDLDIRAGEIHAILGENGAGKTTLMKTLFGMLQPDEGEIYFRGQPVRFRSPLDAIELGIGMVHQHRKLVSAHTALENIVLGHPKVRGVLRLKQAEEEIRDICERYGFNIDPRHKVWQLTEGEKQIVEILKALYRGAQVLILDEPTSALSPLETEQFLESIKAMTGDELALVPFITHKLPIVLATSHRVTVLREGRVVARLDTRDATERGLAMEMVGREVLFRVARPETERGQIVLEVEGLTALNDKGLPALQDVSFSIREGEILGIAAVAGNGQHELAEVIAGLRPAEGGRVLFEGKDITRASILDRWQMGIAYTPAERTDVGSVGDFSLVENVAMNFYFDKTYSRWGLLDYRKIRQLTRELIDEYAVATPSPDAKADHLSGGNLQRLILARVLARRPRLLVANLPTQGLDIGAAEFVRTRLVEAKQARAAVLLISEDLDEIFSLMDWVAPLYEGRVMAILPAGNARREAVGALMAGVVPEEASGYADR